VNKIRWLAWQMRQPTLLEALLRLGAASHRALLGQFALEAFRAEV
jgi:hypothetical protein